MNIDDYLRLLPKTELHCHFTSTMSAAQLIAFTDREGAEPPTTDDALFFRTDMAREFQEAIPSFGLDLSKNEAR